MHRLQAQEAQDTGASCACCRSCLIASNTYKYCVARLLRLLYFWTVNFREFVCYSTLAYCPRIKIRRKIYPILYIVPHMFYHICIRVLHRYIHACLV